MNEDIYGKVTEKIIDNYSIKLIPNKESIKIIINSNDYDIFESIFKFDFFQQFLKEKETIKEISEFIIKLIEEKKIEIQQDENVINLILKPEKNDTESIKLTLNKKSKLSEELIEILINKINILEKENKTLNLNFENLKEKYELTSSETKKLKNQLEEQNKLILSYEDKIDDLEKRIDDLEENNNNFPFQKKKTVQLTNITLQLKNTFEIHNDTITSISTFPSGNIITVSNDFSIKIINSENYNIIQQIEKAHDGWITYVLVLNDDKFITCSSDESLKIWIKKDNIFKLHQKIENAHYGIIKKIINCSNGNLITCSEDNSIKFWEEKYNQYELIHKLNDNYSINSILLLEDKNRLISSGTDGTKLWSIFIDDIKNVKLIKFFEETFCYNCYSLERIDEEFILVCGSDKKSLKLINIIEERIIKKIKIKYHVNVIKSIFDKGIFLIGSDCNIIIYRSDNFQCIENISNAHKGEISGFVELKNELVGSFSSDKNLKIWDLNY